MENHLRGTLKAFGLKTGKTSRLRFEPRIRELVAGNAALVEAADGLLQIRRVLLDRLETYDRKVLEIVTTDAVCRRLMTAPGVGPIVALSYRTAMDTPARFARSRDIGAYFGLTPKRYQSGKLDRSGRISQGRGRIRPSGALRGGHSAAPTKRETIGPQELGDTRGAAPGTQEICRRGRLKESASRMSRGQGRTEWVRSR